MKTAFLISLPIMFLAVLPSEAELITVQAGNHSLLANTASQVVEVLVAGNGQLQGVNFDVQIGNGKTGQVPAITNVDIVGTGLLFNASNTGQTGDGSGSPSGFAGFWSASTTTVTGTTVAPGLPNSVLARVEVNTTGFNGGTFELILNDGKDILTGFAGWEGRAGNTLQISNGTITVVPEPATILLFFGMGSIGFATFGYRHLRCRSNR